MIAKRRLSRHDDFGAVLEVSTGEDFLETVFDVNGPLKSIKRPILVLMDINMPRLNGFETIEELQRRMDSEHGPESVVILMFTSSDNPDDRERADALELVKGYVMKPLDEKSVQHIHALYFQLI